MHSRSRHATTGIDTTIPLAIIGFNQIKFLQTGLGPGILKQSGRQHKQKNALKKQSCRFCGRLYDAGKLLFQAIELLSQQWRQMAQESRMCIATSSFLRESMQMACRPPCLKASHAHEVPMVHAYMSSDRIYTERVSSVVSSLVASCS